MASPVSSLRGVVSACLLLATGIKTASAQATCVSADQPNPLITVYPNNVTGTLNTTMLVVPIPLTTARNLIPNHYNILEKAYRELLPDFPHGMYPAFFQGGHDHDIHVQGFSIPDFNVSYYLST